MKYDIIRTAQFKRDYKAIQKRNYDVTILMEVVRVIANGEELPEKYKDHTLTGNWAGYRECHIQPDWLLIYRIEDDNLILVLSRTGNHSDLFAK